MGACRALARVHNTPRRPTPDLLPSPAWRADPQGVWERPAWWPHTDKATSVQRGGRRNAVHWECHGLRLLDVGPVVFWAPRPLERQEEPQAQVTSRSGAA